MRHTAANSKRYREREKERNPDYMTKERARVKKYYVPTCELTPAEAEERRRKARESMRRQRRRKAEVAKEVTTSTPPVATPEIPVSPLIDPSIAVVNNNGNN